MNLVAEHSQLLTLLARAIGEPNLLQTGDLSAYERDWRGRSHGKALAVAKPAHTGEVGAVVRLCAQHGVSIVPQGGNTGLVVGSTPDETGQQVVLSLQRMRQIRAIDTANKSITVEAGCVLQAVQEAAAAQGLLFPLSLAAEGSCTIGGNLATNAGGTQVLRYGTARELCLGLEFVTPQGEVISALSGLRKDNTGYDLRHLLIGSEGTLGIITAATLKLWPMPKTQLKAWVAVPSVPAAVALLGLAQQQLGDGLTGFELMGKFALSLVAKHMPQHRVPLWPGASQDNPYSVVLAFDTEAPDATATERLEAFMASAFEAELVADGVIAQNLAQAKALWHVRESIPLAQVQEGLNIKHDISLPVSRIAEFCDQTGALLAQELPGIRLVNFGHVGDGNLHYNVQCPEGGDDKAFLQTQEAKVNHIVYQAVHAYGGSISAEHGIGSLKRDELPHYKSPTALEMMRAIKQALDPKNTLNPGRVLGDL